VSTIGVRSPSEGYSDGIVPDGEGGGGGGGGDNAGGGRTRVIFDMPDKMMLSGADDCKATYRIMAAALVKKYAGGDVANNSTATPAASVDNDYDVGRANGEDCRAKDAISSLEGRIALGEEQMRRMNQPGAAAAPVATAGAMGDRVSDGPKKRPFLRRGTRKEPSALHATIAASRNSRNTNSGNNNSNPSTSNPDWITPSTARRRQRSNDNDVDSTSSSSSSNPADGPPPTTTGTSNAGAAGSNESLPERLARLARLEKMQEDLIKDLERRQARKEEAQRERRRSAAAGNGRNAAVAVVPVNTPAAASARRAIAAIAATAEKRDVVVVVAPSHARSRSSVAAPSGEGGGGHVRSTTATSGGAQGAGEQTPSQARRNNSERTPSQVRAEQWQQLQQQQKTASQVRAEQQPQISAVEETSVTGNIDPPTTQQQDGEDIITPSQARKIMGSPASTKMKPSPFDAIVDKYISESYGEGVAGFRIEGREVKFQVDEKENVGKKGNQAVTKKGLKSGSAIEQAGSKPTVPPRTTPAARTSGARLNSTAKMRYDDKASLSVNEDKRKAFEEWKKKEEELIKNMRRRQEVALREVEGERERVSVCCVPFALWWCVFVFIREITKTRSLPPTGQSLGRRRKGVCSKMGD
jgi:hypothetical protein